MTELDAQLTTSPNGSAGPVEIPGSTDRPVPPLEQHVANGDDPVERAAGQVSSSISVLDSPDLPTLRQAVDAWPAADEPAPVEPSPEEHAAGRQPSRLAVWWEDRSTRQRVESLTTLLVVGGVVLFTLSMLSPSKIFTPNVPTGGDMGAHVWGPAYLRDHLLPHWQLTGYSDSWYEGFPVYRYYMLPPALLIVLLNTFLSYGAAFKIVVVLGILTLPITAWKFGKLARFAYPIPALFSVAAGIFLFDESFKIQGGNIASTMAGEFSFSIALSLSLLAFGYFAAGMETGKYRLRAAVLIALAMLCHGIVLLFVGVGIVWLFLSWVGTERYPAGWTMPVVATCLLVVAWLRDMIGQNNEWVRQSLAVAVCCFLVLAIFGLFRVDRKRYVWGIPVMLVSVALMAFWFGPFIGTKNFLTDMKYEPAPGVPDWETWWKMYFPHTTTTDRFWMLLAIAGIVGAIVRRHRNGIFLASYGIFLAAGVKFAHASLPGVGLLWDTRVLPFFYLLRYMLAMLGLFEIVCLVRTVWNHSLVSRAASVSAFHPLAPAYAKRVSRASWEKRNYVLMAVTLVGTGLIAIGWLDWHLGRFPGEKESYSAKNGWQFTFPHWGADGGVTLFATSSKNKGFVDGWTKYNFKGYVDKPAYGEYRALIESMIQVGKTQGCGRALYEEPPGDYGTTLALMPLPFWTDNCIKSSEGLFFESSATTPYHFLAKAAMSQSASNPVRGLAYENQNAKTGVREMQQLGIRYYMAFTPQAIARADKQAGLVELTAARSGPWHIYQIANSDLVVPLTTRPVVVNQRGGDQKERWLEIGQSYFQHPEDWVGTPAADGPKDWQRVDVAPVAVEKQPKVEQVRSTTPIVDEPLAAVKVTNVRQSDESVSFTVDQIGVPVEVKVSYFPNWTVSGADGPYRIAPNMMVVVPRQQNVHLQFKRSGVDKLSYLVTLFGLFGLYGLWVLNKRQKWSAQPAGLDAYGWSPSDFPGLAIPVALWSDAQPQFEVPLPDDGQALLPVDSFDQRHWSGDAAFDEAVAADPIPPDDGRHDDDTPVAITRPEIPPTAEAPPWAPPA
jgi:hypothetical protein